MQYVFTREEVLTIERRLTMYLDATGLIFNGNTISWTELDVLRERMQEEPITTLRAFKPTLTNCL